MEQIIAWWQQLPYHMSPELFSCGALHLRYYGLMYLAALLSTYGLISYRLKTEPFGYSADTIQGFLFWGMTGVLLGGRLGYVLFYNAGYYAHHPLEILLPWDFSQGMRFIGISGMSYHGGALGLIAAALLFCRRRRIDFWNFAELFAPAFPLGYTFGRIGNFINGELYGRSTSVPWGMYFPLDSSHLLRHPSQLYEALGEGILLFIILWSVRKRSPFDGFLLAVYLIGYGAVRFCIEFFREPDPQIGYLFSFFTMGQMLCIAMILLGAAVYEYRARTAVPTWPTGRV
ncbi:MAG: prolipoprotein diacylglyceryl transferase [Deltaproteobacteria bacterium]|nr:prolipoprotein diacylglyceryl transferase [Deltaproteobacteria bacterium]